MKNSGKEEGRKRNIESKLRKERKEKKIPGEREGG
jgi:hypothetical protein